MRITLFALGLVALLPISLPAQTQDAKPVPSPANTTQAPEGKQTPVAPKPVIAKPVPLYTPAANYTEWARSEKIQGNVKLMIIVGEDGRVIDAKVTQPLGYGLDESAVKTVMTWKLKPGTFNGKPVKVSVPVIIEFHLYERN